MKATPKRLMIFLVALLFMGCQQMPNQQQTQQANAKDDFEREKKAIMETLQNETKAAFKRDYQEWTRYWVHDPDITKIYIDFADSTFSESVGWHDISGFVKNFIEEHPDPEPVPELINDIDVRLYGNGAWVTFEQNDSLRGLKRETRLMEKIDGQWKIAGMQTTIYGHTE